MSSDHEVKSESLTIGEAFKSVGGWMAGGELGYPSFGSMDALRVYTEKMIRAVLARKAQEPALKAGWVSVSDECKPKGRTPILVAVDYVRYGEHEDGTPGEYHGQTVAEGEYVPNHGEPGDGYFTCYSSPHGDSEVITHWQPIPNPPAKETNHVPA